MSTQTYGKDAACRISKTSTEEDEASGIFPLLLYSVYCHRFECEWKGPPLFHLSPFPLRPGRGGSDVKGGEIPKKPTMIVSIPTLLDSALAPAGQHLMKVLVNVSYPYQGKWGKGSPEDYRRIKEEFSKKILQQLESKLFPGLRDHLLFHEAATPLTLERYTGNEWGDVWPCLNPPADWEWEAFSSDSYSGPLSGRPLYPALSWHRGSQPLRPLRRPGHPPKAASRIGQRA